MAKGGQWPTGLQWAMTTTALSSPSFNGRVEGFIPDKSILLPTRRFACGVDGSGHSGG